MKNRIGNLCMILGTALVLAALALLLWNREEDRAAGKAVNEIIPQMVKQIEEPGQQETPGCPDPYDPAMTEIAIDGYGYIGYLSIPAIQVELPVMAQWDYDRLKIAPCRYAGSTKTGSLVVCAHNYTQHFGPIGKLVSGDRVAFTDMDGLLWQYEVAAVDILPPTAIEDMTAGEYDLTLFTCTYGGQSRVTVRCERIEKEEKTEAGKQ